MRPVFQQQTPGARGREGGGRTILVHPLLHTRLQAHPPGEHMVWTANPTSFPNADTPTAPQGASPTAPAAQDVSRRRAPSVHQTFGYAMTRAQRHGTLTGVRRGSLVCGLV
jgi:hypothetical protein